MVSEAPLQFCDCNLGSHADSFPPTAAELGFQQPQLQAFEHADHPVPTVPHLENGVVIALLPSQSLWSSGADTTPTSKGGLYTYWFRPKKTQ